MMTNLFSSFDPSTPMLSLNWLSLMIIMIIIPSWFWLIPSRLNLMWIKLTIYLHKEFKILTNSKGGTIMFISLFLTIMINNFMGLFPYIFTSTSHMSITLSLALPLWMTFMIFGWTNNTKHMFAHLVPQGTPMILMPFMVCIETISNIIRPGTLAIRLSANMIAGHLLLTLLGNAGNIMTTYSINILIITQMILLILEMAVSIIQSYVFAILSTLYSSEVN
uniref:ATP synthase subunit a n=1 Tax=Rhadinosa nigrocyanea TaxID=2093842 RepID=A0A343UQA3_9CUCU|nr:ATP synthase F0 subunit 6 [Rhadinosa nigrocyanea]AVF96878.1 ATP synthase F0 subunit 6 [Rhadinosa nigrocyanea]